MDVYIIQYQDDLGHNRLEKVFQNSKNAVEYVYGEMNRSKDAKVTNNEIIIQGPEVLSHDAVLFQLVDNDTGECFYEYVVYKFEVE